MPHRAIATVSSTELLQLSEQSQLIIFGVYMHASSSPMEDLVKDVRNRNKNISNDEKNGEKKKQKNEQTKKL